MKLMAIDAGGREHVGITLTDYNNYLRIKWKVQVKAGETRRVLQHLQQMQGDDCNFYYAEKHRHLYEPRLRDLFIFVVHLHKKQLVGLYP